MKHLRVLILGFSIIALMASATPASKDKFNSSMRFLRQLKQAPAPRTHLDKRVLAAVQTDKAVVTVKFDHVLSSAEIAGYEDLGLSFYRIDGEAARTRAIYPVKVPWSKIDELAGRTEVLRLESTYRPAIYPTLDVSRPEIEADSDWTRLEIHWACRLTGKGMRIADFDTGIDVFHPSFFMPTGTLWTGSIRLRTVCSIPAATGWT